MKTRLTTMIVIFSATILFCAQKSESIDVLKLEENNHQTNLNVVFKLINIQLITRLKLKENISRYIHQKQYLKNSNNYHKLLIIVISQKSKIKNTKHFFISIELYQEYGKSIIPIKDIWYMGQLKTKELNDEINKLFFQLFESKNQKEYN